MALAEDSPMVVTPEIDFAKLPEADKDPLLQTLRNANGMWVEHAPSLLPVIYTCEQNIASRSAVFRLAISPSVDGLSYAFTHKIWSGTGAGTLTVLVEEWTGAAWNTIENTAGIAAPASTSNMHEHTDTIDANATMLRCTYTRAGADPFTPDSLHVRPDGAQTLAVGTQSSGFKAFDDGGLNGGSAGINTEHLNRGPQNAMAILADRKQAVWTYAQEDDQTAALYFADDSPLSDGLFAVFAEAMSVIPYQKSATIEVYAIGSVDGGGTADLIRLTQAGGANVTLDASDGVESGTLALKLQSRGQLSARALLRLDGQNTAGQSMTIHSVTAYWVPGT